MKAYLIWQFIKWNKKKRKITYISCCSATYTEILSIWFRFTFSCKTQFHAHMMNTKLRFPFLTLLCYFFICLQLEFLLLLLISRCRVCVCVILFFFYSSIRKTHTKQSNQPIWIICIVFSGIILPFSHELHTTNAYI